MLMIIFISTVLYSHRNHTLITNVIKSVNQIQTNFNLNIYFLSTTITTTTHGSQLLRLLKTTKHALELHRAVNYENITI